MRTKVILSVIGVVLVGLLFVYVGARPAATAGLYQGTSETELHTVTVNGEGRISLTPDMAAISVGVTTEDKEAAKAVKTNTTKANDVVAKLKEFGIAEKDIRTTNFTVYPRQQFDSSNKPTETTYVVENTVYVKVSNLDKVGEILDAVVKAGANTISNIQFDISDPSDAYDQALEAAVQDAYGKAQVAAKAAGVKLGPVHSIQTSLSSSGQVSYARNLMAAAPAAPEVPVSPGQMDVVVNVTIVYLIGG